MDNLGSLEEKVMLLVQTVRKQQEEMGRLQKEIAQRDEELEAAGAEKEELQKKIDDYRQLGAENEVLRNKHEEARVRVDQIITKLEKFEAEIGSDASGQAELITEDNGEE
jgi:chromosome segregation ATPase